MIEGCTCPAGSYDFPNAAHTPDCALSRARARVEIGNEVRDGIIDYDAIVIRVPSPLRLLVASPVELKKRWWATR